MELNNKEIIIKDQTIVTFYENNPNLNIIDINLVFIDILNKLSINLNETLTNTINQKKLSTLTDLSKDISGFKQDISIKLNDTKKEYIDNVKLILDNTTMSTTDKINHIIATNNEIIIHKTTNILNEALPKNNELHLSTINTSLKMLQQTIAEDTRTLIDNIHRDDNSIAEFIINIDTKFNTMIQNLQQPIFSVIQLSEERTNNNIQQIRDKIISQQTSQDSLNNGIQEFLNKYKHNSSSKGNISEQQLYTILQQIFPCDEIIDCSNETATCDYRVNRFSESRPTILFENKDYSRSVTTEEIKKFERDISIQKHHGIFISQKSNITFKEPFQIDIINNLIHIYIPNAEYNIDKIKIAVEIIDSLSNKIVNIHQTQNDTIFISKEDIGELMETFNDFNTQKNNIIETIKTNNKILIEKIEVLQLNSIKKILNKNGFFNTEDDFRCKHCTIFVGKNKASLGAHFRNCKLNPINKEFTQLKTNNNNSVL
jgi:hypothetical protein